MGLVNPPPKKILENFSINLLNLHQDLPSPAKKKVHNKILKSEI